ncbi:(Fe-S)-binding protein [Pyrobaculum sp. 3827-6]|uniref:(Fe-S)-binding protein n=1 Tax=Pyrobaculum sp. 3827-6 TaxID=2983604 RepID=UPI0021D8B2CB|nr:(Fe-S)-binding protein [Pyrobaculum sp. 3827-6]MCU7788497.1 (Fe-S)-binding protein [Pyrobaculum sp. 3827-6]
MVESWISELRSIVIHSLEKSWLPFPTEAGICESWKQGLESDRESGTVLYTSCMYHLAPVIEKAVENLEKFGVTKGGLRSRLAGVVAKTAGQLLVRPDQSEIRRADEVIRKIYGLLKRRGIRIRLLEREVYSGALLYELGLEKDFADYAQRVAKFFKEAGVREIITVDPHTHYILEKVYPRYVPSFDFKVLSYIDLIDSNGTAVKSFAIHDSCLYARFLGRYDVVRKLLSAGEPVEHPYYTGRDTSGCCGGPIESLFPDVARKVAQIRVRDLAKLSKDVVVQCPICYVNLKRASNGEVRLYYLPEVLL